MAYLETRWEMELECPGKGFRFYPESNGEGLKGFKQGNGKVQFTSGQDNFRRSVNLIEGKRQEAEKLVGSCFDSAGEC